MKKQLSNIVIEIKNGPDDGKTYRFSKTNLPVQISRSGYGNPDGISLLYDGYVSRRHAQIEQENGILFIKDHNSNNGYCINDFRYSPGSRSEIKDNDIIRIGETLMQAHIKHLS